MVYVSLNSSSFQTIRPNLKLNEHDTNHSMEPTVHIDDVYTNLSWLRDHKTPRGTSQKKLKDYGEIFQGTDRSLFMEDLG